MWKRVFKGNKQDEANATKAHEGVQNSMYFDKEKGRWRERGKEHLEQEEVVPPPPPMGATKPAESDREASGDGQAADNDAQKEASALDALTAPPNLYANMLSRGKTPAQKSQRPMGFGNFPTMQPATTVREERESDEGKDNAAADRVEGGPPSAPFVSTADSGPPSNPFAPKMAAVPSNPFAPKSSGGTTCATSNPFAPKNPGGAAGSNMNPNAPRAFGGGATTVMNPLPPRGRLPREEREKARKPQPREKAKSNPIYANIPAYNPGFTMADTISRADADDMLPEAEGGEDNSLANEQAHDLQPNFFFDSTQLPPPPPVPEPLSSHEDALDSLSPLQSLNPSHSTDELAPAAASPPVPPVPAIPQLRVRNSPFGGGRQAAMEPVIPEAAPLEDQSCELNDEDAEEREGEIGVGAQASGDEDETQTAEQTAACVGDGSASDTQFTAPTPAVAETAALGSAALNTPRAHEFEDGELIEGRTESENAAILKIQSNIRGHRARSLSNSLRSAKQARMASESVAPEVTNSMTDSWGDLGGMLADAPPATTVATGVVAAEAAAPEPTPAADLSTIAPASVPAPAEATVSGWDDDFDFDDADFAAPIEAAEESAAETARPSSPKEEVADGNSIAPVEPAVVAEEEVQTTGDVQADPCMSANGESISSWVVLSDEQRGTSGEGTSGETTVADSPVQAASPSIEAGSPTLAAGQVDAEITKHQAALRLQAKHRGNVGRSEMRRIKSDREERRASALHAEEIAAALGLGEQEHAAVTKIQSMVRGNRDRLRSNSLRTAAQVEALSQPQETESKNVEVTPAVSASEISYPEVAKLRAEIEKLRQDNADLQQRLKEADTVKVQDLLIRNAELESKLHEADVIHQTAREQLDEARQQVAEAEKRADAAVDAAAKASAAASAAPTKAEKFASPGGDEFNLPDFVWSCGNSEVMAFVQKLVAEVNDLKKQSATASPHSTAGAFPVDSAIAFVNKIEERDGHQIQPLLKLLADHADNAQVCSQALTAMENLTFTVVENRQTIVQHGGIEAILSVMERHKELGTAIQRPAMDALWNLTFCEDAVDRVNFSNGIERIVDAMRRDPDISELQGSACAVILNLAVQEDVRRRVVDCGALNLISGAMQRHAENEEVLEQGCQALYMLAYHQELRPHVIAARGDDMATLAASCKNDAGRAQMWGRWLQEVLLA
eukprot:TRINITY_DN23476_c1_g1_i1.p1 TRINITY_DN23476_c1_g1~~TRINITY_DN23476_c1_g1_i1.p1  ORF type:complete len:1191 (-),score=243.14 TRINITY_DN23476_c1_g1_i1:269-3841(-)